MILTSNQTFMIEILGGLNIASGLLSAWTAYLDIYGWKKLRILLGIAVLFPMGVMMLLWITFSQDICSNIIQIKGV
jgi:hypothetical protein